ncbi:MAG: acetyl-CoA carboxylase biotin carboxylase subunit [Deltaproteobacteria bacterium]|jgi:acetyl-CoA carboxylase biotin carboxylase subunit|nr:acetyl-CoA carboxylase biotin carboxylase subunit [Deltaproteobacteria bacterium]MBW2535493.1 acetyl-CoA carboxylase biotin carboxylase subunit [Deltaproteobacteria bacterium]
MFSKVLVANRGEIALRIQRTLREMGITTVAVYSRADEGAPHVLEADEAVLLGDAEPAESYLHAERIVEAAKRTGAEAIHPGYGFLSENADFAAQVRDAGLTFIGPPAEVIASLGDKVEARRLMASRGVPVIPGMDEGTDDLAALGAAARTMGFPVLVKAVAGGGGKGMRVVASESELDESLGRATSEAKAAFGDGRLFLEKYLEKPRHVEVQIVADRQGHVIHLGERECSIQRRYQKIIEETPSPAVNDELRQRLGEAAVAAARAAGYVNAGTVEFMVDQSGEFYFLEVNTRLQVEHPITELCVGMDLVRLQLEIAAGRELGFEQDGVRPRGHGIECRVYAEDPARGFMPAPGKILLCRGASGPGVRFDSGIRAGYTVPVEYDPLLGKLCAWAETRPLALARMERALAANVVLGVPTTTELMLDVIRSEPFRRGETHTRFLDEHFADWQPSPEGDRWALLGYAAAELCGAGQATTAASARPDGERTSPWQTLGAWDPGRSQHS